MMTDPHSAAQADIARVTELTWEATINFDQKIIAATAHWQIEKAANAREIRFDSHRLTIQKVWLDGQETDNFKLEARDKSWLGDVLIIPLEENTKKVSIQYQTSPAATAVQWLNPEQTADKRGSFLFTQSQAILARTWLPCQDSPGIRFSYNASVQVPAGMLALMSAENPQQLTADGAYTFKQPKPIPAYLMALAVGYMDFKAIDEQSGVYAEASMLDKSWWEFQELPGMIKAAEKLYGPYAWGRYDLLVLPPSFPFGGMENPMLTFATPTILAGDRSLTSLVAHELAHSWSGNLVTNANWNDFWLNEGFTVYFERRIMEDLLGAAYAEMLASLGFQDLQHTLADFGEKSTATCLKLSIDQQNPDDGMNDIAYEKGYSLLRLIENEVGRAQMDTFLRNYFNRFAFQVMTTENFIQYLQKELLSEEQFDRLQIKRWIYEPGLPENAPQPSPNQFVRVENQLQNWLNNQPIDTALSNQWSSHEWLHFIRSLPEQISMEQLSALDNQFGFTQSGNSEILAAWFIPAIQKQYEPAYPAIESFLKTVGRRKFLVPIYKSLLAETHSHDWAKRIYNQARPNYHSVATQTLDAMMQ